MDNKGNKQWIWLALDVNTREIVGVYIGDRDEKAAKKLGNSLPPIGYANPTAFGWRIAKRDYRQCAVAYTDFWAAYGAVFPSQRHKAVEKAKQRGLGGFPAEPKAQIVVAALSGNGANAPSSA